MLLAPDAPGRALFESTSQLPVLSMFKSAGEILLAHESLDEMLQQVVNLIAEHLPGRRGAVCMVDPASGEIQPLLLQRRAGSGRAGSGEQGARSREREQAASTGSRSRGGADERTARRLLPAPRYPLAAPCSVSRSILHEAVRVQRAMLVASVADDPRFHAAASIQQMGIRSAICVPLYHQGQVTGVIYVDSQRDAGPLSSRDLEVLTVLGLMVAAGIAQISLRSDVARERTMRAAPGPLQFAAGRRADHEAHAAAGRRDAGRGIRGQRAVCRPDRLFGAGRELVGGRNGARAEPRLRALDGQRLPARRHVGQVYRRCRDGGLRRPLAAGRSCPAGRGHGLGHAADAGRPEPLAAAASRRCSCGSASIRAA